ncbi:hypothetical protein CHARACLAT_028878 [Characodon lateralis]|uniref:Uncharacterized protein n=1 Tax=Characodon lateralis TaxID=208331 RepID=A0ABU7D1J3_9TELE|nr:hypothetical protein [Characodon lateralis]
MGQLGSETAAPVTLSEERVGGGYRQGWRRGWKQRKREGKSPGPNKAMGVELGWVPLCFKYAGRLQVRVWWLGLGTGNHHSCCSLPQESLIISVLGIQDASGGCRPQAGLQGCPVQTQKEQPEESLGGWCC